MDPTFPDSLTDEERGAFVYFKDSGGHGLIRDCQLGMLISMGEIEATARAHCRAMSAGLRKAPLHQGTVFRGLWGSKYVPGSVDFCRSILASTGIYCLPSHASATLQEDQAISFAVQAGNPDREVCLAIVLRVHAATARDISAIQHSAGDEQEVMLVRGSRFEVVRPERASFPSTTAECWTMEWKEVV